jgi:gas vesicle protein
MKARWFASHARGNEEIMSSGTYEASEGNRFGMAVTFLLVGVGIGALAALALAPKSGKQLRRDLKRGYEDAKDTLQDWTEEARDKARGVSERVRGVAERGASLAEELRERAEPLRRAVTRS